MPSTTDHANQLGSGDELRATQTAAVAAERLLTRSRIRRLVDLQELKAQDVIEPPVSPAESEALEVNGGLDLED